MHIHFVSRDGAILSAENLIAYVLERPRYSKSETSAASYSNPDTGAAFTLDTIDREDGRVPLRLAYPTRMGLPFAVEVADELEAITSHFDLLIARSAAIYNEDAPFVRARFLAAYTANLRTWIENDVKAGKLTPPRIAKWWLDHCYQFNSQLATMRAWIWSEHPDGDIPRVVCIREPASKAAGRLVTAVVWDGRAAVLPEVDYVLRGTNLAVPIADVTKDLGSSKSHSERFTINDATYEVGLRHWILDNDQRAAMDQAMRTATLGEPSPVCPWPLVIDEDLMAEITLLPLFERMSRGIVEPSFELAWNAVSAHRPTFTMLGGDGKITRRQGFEGDEETIGHATPNEVMRVAKALVDSRYPNCRTDRATDDFRPPTCACSVHAVGFGMHYALESYVESADFDRLREAVWSVFQDAEGRPPAVVATPTTPTYATAKEAIDDFLRARGHAWRVEPLSAKQAWSPDLLTSTASPIVPPGYQQQVKHSCGHQLDIDWKKSTLVISEFEDKGSDSAEPVSESIDDVWLERFKALRWP